jgi:hypothetical protein
MEFEEEAKQPPEVVVAEIIPKCPAEELVQYQGVGTLIQNSPPTYPQSIDGNLEKEA